MCKVNSRFKFSKKLLWFSFSSENVEIFDQKPFSKELDNQLFDNKIQKPNMVLDFIQNLRPA